jgi:hypothetical protein
MMKREWQVKTCKELVSEYTPLPKKGTKLQFSGVGDRDVYNITAPFTDNGETFIIGRVEARDTEHSEAVFFTKVDDVWVANTQFATHNLQDPFIVKINNEWIFGGVEVYFDPQQSNLITGWKTLLYRGTAIRNLQLATSGPWNMKDIRIVELADSSIGIFSRPYGIEGRTALIGFTTIPSFEDLSEAEIIHAPLFRDQFPDNEWGGANEIHLLKNGFLGVVGHIAYKDEGGNLHYHAMAFVVNPKTREKSQIKIIATRSDFPAGPAKQPYLVDVIFSGGIVRGDHNRAVLYVGVSDVEACYVDIPDPFTEFENI